MTKRQSPRIVLSSMSSREAFDVIFTDPARYLRPSSTEISMVLFLPDFSFGITAYSHFSMAHAAARTGAAAAAAASCAVFSGLLKSTVQYAHNNYKEYGSYYDRSKVIYQQAHSLTSHQILRFAQDGKTSSGRFSGTF